MSGHPNQVMQARFQDVAVVGMGCRVADGIQSPEQLWQALLGQKVASTEMPPKRWAPYHNRDSRNPKVMSQVPNRGYYVEDIEGFDCQFFGISPKEAEQMDPQQRVSLEVAWEALEDAGISAKTLGGSDTAVFWGVNSNDYGSLILEDLANIDAWMGIGTAYCGVPNRISYHLNLMGPSVAVDAACASSLVAVHHGIKAIVGGESKIAIVGGVNALCSPGLTTVLARAGVISSEGQCRSFDDTANGYGRGEGAGAVVLKNLSQAVHDGDHIMAVIKGSAVAHNGRNNGIMAPNAKAQQLVAQKALHAAGIDPHTVRYVEAHATSTALGDPTEVSAVAETYGVGRPSDDPCYIGSIKPNIGHLEAGAGVMGLIKAVLAIQKGILPPQANLQTLNTRINWQETGLRVVQKPTDWPNPNDLRRAAVCSYGYGGTVSHAILEEFPQYTKPYSLDEENVHSMGPQLLLLSAPQEQRLPASAELLSTWIRQQGSELGLADLCQTMATRRSHHDFRISAVVEDIDGVIAALDCIQQHSTGNPWIAQSRVLPSDVRKDVVWVFSGHGAQWTNMGKELVNSPAFYDAVEPLDVVVREEIGLSPIEWLHQGDFASSDRIQILTYIVQIGISAVLNSHGIFPQAVIGHSVGEIAASVVAGALSPIEGALIVTRRAVLYRQVMGHGAMALVSRSSEYVCQDLNEKGATNVTVAIDSSPSSCVIAGPREDVAIVVQQYQDQGTKTFTVKTDIAFHSPAVLSKLGEPLLSALRDALQPTQPAVQLYSTSLSDARGQDPRDTSYWVNNMISPVKLTSAVGAAIEDGHRRFLEVSSHPVVSHSISETIMDHGVDDFSVLTTLCRDQPAIKNILHAVGRLYCSGADINNSKQRRVNNWIQGIPTGPWMHRPLWREATTTGTADVHDVNTHTLLGKRTAVAGTEMVVFSTTLDQDTKPFPLSHPVSGTEIIPAACLINTFLGATGTSLLQNINLKVPVAVGTPRNIQVVVKQDHEVKLMSRLAKGEQRDEDSWVTHTTGHGVNCRPEAATEVKFNISAVKARIGAQLRDDFTIDYLAKVGVGAMGFPWTVTEHHGNTSEMIARVDVAPASEIFSDWSPSSWAPFLDAATSIGSTIFFDIPRLRMPAQIQQVEVFTEQNPPKVGWVYVQQDTNTEYSSHVYIVDESGTLLAKFTSMRFSEIEGTPGASGGSISGLVHRLAWPPALPAEKPIRVEKVILIGSDVAMRDMYAKTLPTHVRSFQLSGIDDLDNQLPHEFVPNHGTGTVIVYIPHEVHSLQEVPVMTETFTWQLLEVTKFFAQRSLPVKIFVLTDDATQGETPTALAHAPLLGLSRIIASEHPNLFGGLIDCEQRVMPLAVMKYIQGADIIRISDGIARTARLRAFSPEDRTHRQSKSLPRPEGTYLIVGGLGVLGFAVAEFLAEQGARRLVLVSRRSLPPRRTWDTIHDNGIKSTITKIQALEQKGVSVHTVSIDITNASATSSLLGELDRLGLPPVLGVIHAAGVLENQLIMETTQDALNCVLSAKVSGTLALHEAFPPNTLDFFVLFSSCGQLFGFPGQGSYASSNAFLDTLATHRRNLGDNAVAFQWTAWQGMGLGSDSDFVAAELESKGITNVNRHDAFQAWLHLAQYDTDHGVVLRSRVFDEGEPLPTPIMNDIAIRRATEPSEGGESKSGSKPALPSSGPELKSYLDEQIRICVANVLNLSADEIDSKATLSNLGLDSVMSVSLRRQLQQAFKINVPPTLVWNYPTTYHLVGWFFEKLAQ